jgi:hypothetical protein
MIAEKTTTKTKKETRSELEIIADRIEQAEHRADSLMLDMESSFGPEELAAFGQSLLAVETRIARLKQEFKEADKQA